jgi:hypothetical protein
MGDGMKKESYTGYFWRIGDLLWFDCFNWLLPIKVRFWWWNVCWNLKGEERVKP